MIRVVCGIVLAAAVAGCASALSPSPSPPPSGASTAPRAGITRGVPTPPAPLPVAALRLVHDPGRVTGMLTGPCHYRDRGQLPDPSCTPGAVDPQVTAAVLCSPGYRTSAYRPPVYQTSRFKYEQAYPAYGVADVPGTRSELDHLVPLELGGANDAANLWPELGGVPNRKDGVERALHDAVCSGRVTLAAAQAAIAQDWATAETVLGIKAGSND